ncbi:glycosyltransferase [Parvibaculum sedimenti]|nr:glycosyltransferase [Parvibaculum sedimenti]
MSKIVHIITRFVNGGADENTLLTCNAQAASGHDVSLVYGADNTNRMVAQLDARVRRVCLPSLVREIALAKDVTTLFRLARLMRRLRPDVVHTHTSKAGIIGRVAALASPGAVIVHGVHILPFTAKRGAQRLIYLGLEKLMALTTHAFINVSDGMRDECLAHGIGRPERHWVIESGMDVAKFRGALPAGDILSGISAADVPIRVGYVAALERRKRHRELLEAVVPLLKRHMAMQLVLAGEGPERQALETAAREAGVEAQVRLLGFRDDVEAVLAACDVCVFVSEREGLPRALVQYALAGKPIVATRLPGIERVLQHDRNGYLVDTDSFDEFTRRLEALIVDPELRETMAARSMVIDLSDWDAARMTERIDGVYEALLARRSLAGGRAAWRSRRGRLI